ncbi:hypothetical protein MW290_22000 [Aquincola tertiaricarbonis]|uniref:Uncharacterized protein n=1 Tax=Aquincola tertiaricarbonis TaxID=391953 RepID=A0ABY4SF18_AQUTE|nr:hypothetical protein [Aquincola tertiaricarbonis]URI11614.1 hypothetical protein MW290_22000 [Aquincola tertiaricarbonis]
MIEPKFDTVPPKSKQEHQLWVRLQHLRLWNATQVPPEYADQIPNSIRGLGKWSEPKLGIKKMTDANSLSRQHPTWAWRVIEADGLAKALYARRELPQPKKNAQQQATSLRGGMRELESMLVRAVNQYHEAKETAERAVLDAHYQTQIQKDQAEQIERLTSLLDTRDRELAELRRELSKQNVIRLHRP